ncbi:MAG: M48 family metalloprotease [Desulfovibrionaceae bacterium]|nr:M48 family metalloprotease [Desulfovibrionaceae bacterium]
MLTLIPATAQPFFFGGVSIKDEKDLGRKFDATIRARVPVIDDPEVSQYVRQLVQRLVSTLPPQPFTFTSTVIRNNTMNAFAVPGGYIYVLTGLIMHFDDEAELAGVLGHELAHITQRHVASRLERAQYTTFGSLLLAIAGIALGGPGGGALAVGAMGAGQSAMLNYSRIDESEADHIGLQYVCKTGFDPKGMVRAFAILRQKSRMSGSSIPTYLSTHPALGDRIAGLTARIQHLPPQVRNRKTDNRRFLRVKTILWARYGDPQAAMVVFADNSALSSMGRGIVLARQNDVARARNEFERALERDPNDSLILREAGAFHYRKGDLRVSLDLLTRALKINPNDYMASFYYARLMEEYGEYDRAIENFRDVLRRVPEESEVHRAYAQTLNKTRKEALAYIHMTYGALYDGDKKKTEQYLKRAKALAKTPAEQQSLTRLTNRVEEYKKLWKN